MFQPKAGVIKADTHAMLAKRTYPKKGGTIKPDTHINSYMLQSESV